MTKQQIFAAIIDALTTNEDPECDETGKESEPFETEFDEDYFDELEAYYDGNE